MDRAAPTNPAGTPFGKPRERPLLAGDPTAAPPEGFHHEALFYSDGNDGFLAGVLPLVHGSLAGEGSVMVAVGPARAQALREALGDLAADVRFVDIHDAGRNPALIISMWEEFLGTSAGAPMLGIGEPVWPGRGAAELEECERHEALLNLAFDGGPAWRLICPYEIDGLEDAVIEGAKRTHPVLVAGARGSTSADYAGGRDPAPFAGDLPASPGGDTKLDFTAGELPRLRSRLFAWAERHSSSVELGEELVLAVNELATNSILYGGGAGTMRMWRDGATLLCEVEDHGSMVSPLVGRIRPNPDACGGRGVWIANQLCDLVQIRSGNAGTVVRVHKALR